MDEKELKELKKECKVTKTSVDCEPKTDVNEGSLLVGVLGLRDVDEEKASESTTSPREHPKQKPCVRVHDLGATIRVTSNLRNRIMSEVYAGDFGTVREFLEHLMVLHVDWKEKAKK